MKYGKWILWAAMCLLLCGCARESAPEETQAPVAQQQSKPDVSYVQMEFSGLAEPPAPAVAIILEPEAPGTAEKRTDSAVIDYSHAADGYVMAQFMAPSDSRLKVLVKGPTTTYTYNLPQGQWEVFPLSDGSGSYHVCIYQNVYGTKYALVMSTIFDVELTDEFAPFLRPNQYVNYTHATASVDQGLEVTRGLTDPLEKVAAVYDYVVTTLTYDYDKAATVKSGYLPVLDDVLAGGKGICFDYAALMTAMLRSQGIPSKLVVGYAGSTYHAWISVWTEENGWIDGAIFFDGNVWKRMDPTFASSGNRSDEIMDYIENGEYTAKYLY